MSAVGCFGRFTFSHLAFHIPTLAGSCLCLFCVVVCLVALFLCFWFLFCKCLGIPNSPRSLDLDDRQGLIARSAMQQKKKKNIRVKQFALPESGEHKRNLESDLTALVSVSSSRPLIWNLLLPLICVRICSLCLSPFPVAGSSLGSSCHVCSSTVVLA